MTSEKICIASGDDHAGAPMKVYRDYLESWLHPAFDEFYAHHVSRFSTTQQEHSFFPPEANAKFWNTEGYDPELGTAVAWNADLRLKEMDSAMVACSLLIPDDTNSNDPPWGSGLTTAFQVSGAKRDQVPLPLVRAGARAYNRWLADHISADPARLNGLIILGTSDDLVWCAEEIHRAHESGLTGGLLLPLEHDQPLFNHPRYDILWDTCCDLDLPVISHIGRGHPMYAGDDVKVQKMFYGMETMLHAQRPIWTLILGGVLERYPDLRVAVAETGIDWVPTMLARMERTFESAMFGIGERSQANGHARVDFSMRPTEYWQRQVSVIHSVNQLHREFEHESYVEVPNMIFGVDMCHFEGWWPMVGYPEPRPKTFPSRDGLDEMPIKDAYEATFAGLSATDVLAYLEGNFFELFRTFDREALQPVVDRLGPTSADLGLVA